MTVEPTLSHEQVHAIWSHDQLVAFQRMSQKARLEAVKTGALEHWTKPDRDTAFDMVGGAITAAATNAIPTTLAFEAPQKPISSLALRSRWPTSLITLAGGGWLAIVALVSAYVYSLS